MIKVLLLTHVRRVDKHTTIHVAIVDITSEEHVQHRLLFDPGHGLDERLLQEQFV